MKPYNYSEIKILDIPLEGIELIPEKEYVPTCDISFNTMLSSNTVLTNDEVLNKLSKSVESCVTRKQLEVIKNFTSNHFLLSEAEKGNIYFLIRNQERKIQKIN